MFSKEFDKEGANWLFYDSTPPVTAFVKVGLWCLQKKKDFVKTSCQMICLATSLGKPLENTNFFNIATNLIFFSFKKHVVFKVKQT